MLVVYARTNGEQSAKEIYESGIWDFATYPGGTIPFYAGKPGHGIQAYLLDPGTYIPVRCSFDAPEFEHCVPGVWKYNGRLAGNVSFTVKAGEVLNAGRFHVVSERTNYYNIEVINNHENVQEYIQSNWPSLVDDLKYSPYEVRLLRD